MATRIGSTRNNNDGSGTVLATSGTLAVQSGDILIAWSKFEGQATTVTVSDDGSGGTWGQCLAMQAHANDALRGQLHYAIATASASVTITQTLGINRTFRRLLVFAARPAASTTFSLGTSGAAPVGASGTSNTPSAGSLTTDGAGVAVACVGEYTGGTFTNGGGWSEEIDDGSYMEYRLPTGVEAITGDATWTATDAWVAQMAFFLETAVPPISDQPETLHVIRSGIRLR